MQTNLSFLQPSVSANDVAIVAKRAGSTVPAYLRNRMVEALMADISADVSTSYDFSSDEQIDQALLKLKDLSDEFILTAAQFQFDSSRRKILRKLRNKNTEGNQTPEQKQLFETAVGQEQDYAIVKAIAYLEAQRRGLIEKNRAPKTKPKFHLK